MKKISLFILGFTFLFACKKDEVTDPHHDHEEELITTVKLSFQEKNNVSNTTQAIFKDPDGVGGNAPTQFDTIKLTNNKIYICSLSLFNDSKNPSEELTSEIKNEAGEHIFCFTPSINNVVVQRTDSDGKYELGLQSEWTISSAANGFVTVTLKHQPNNTKNGTCTPGETDVEVKFPLKIN